MSKFRRCGDAVDFESWDGCRRGREEAFEDDRFRCHRRRHSDVEELLEDILDTLEDIEECTCEDIVRLLCMILKKLD